LPRRQRSRIWTAVLHPGQPHQIGVDLAAGDTAAAVVRLLLEEVVHPPPGHDVLPQRDGAMLGDDDLGVTADGVEPVAELLRVRHGRRQ
jgi:hypothetical protein